MPMIWNRLREPSNPRKSNRLSRHPNPNVLKDPNARAGRKIILDTTDGLKMLSALGVPNELRDPNAR